MNAGNVSLLNALILIVVGAIGYFSSHNPSVTALIPVIFGVIIAAMNPGVRAENKLQAHIAVVLTLLILFGLFMPLRGAIGRSDPMAIFRVGVMLVSTLAALVAFIKSFIAARKAKQ